MSRKPEEKEARIVAARWEALGRVATAIATIGLLIRTLLQF